MELTMGFVGMELVPRSGPGVVARIRHVLFAARHALDHRLERLQNAG